MTSIDEARAAARSVTESDLTVLLVDLPSQEVVAVSDGMLEMLEIDRGQVLGCRVGTFVAGQHPEILALLASGHLDGAEADRMIRGPGGDVFPVHAWAHVLGDTRPARYAVVLVLDRRPMAAASKPAEVARVYGAVDTQWRVGHISSSVTAVLGYEPDDIIGVSLSDLLQSDDFPQLFAGLAVSYASHLGALARVRFRHGDGSWWLSRMRFAPLTRPPGFGFTMRSVAVVGSDDPLSVDAPDVLRRLSEYLVIEQAHTPPAQLPTRSEIPALGRLSSTEWEVLMRLHTGADPEDISLALGRDTRTIQLHCSSIYDKLGVNGAEGLAALLATPGKDAVG